MASKDIIPAARTMEQLVSIVKKDLLWLFVSTGVAVVTALVVNMFYTV